MGLFENLGSRFLRLRKVFVHIKDIDVKILRGLTEPLRAFVFRPRVSHHDEVIAELHRCMIELAVFSTHRPSIFLQSKRFLEEFHGACEVFVKQVGCDWHSLPPTFRARQYTKPGNGVYRPLHHPHPTKPHAVLATIPSRDSTTARRGQVLVNVYGDLADTLEVPLWEGTDIYRIVEELPTIHRVPPVGMRGISI
jgi:hypothetical protein